MARVFAERFEDGALGAVMRQALEWVDWERLVPQGSRVFIKPNFTYPFHKPGVTTTPAALEALVAILRERAGTVMIGESDGGSHAWTADEAFEGHGLQAIRDRHGAELVNLSRGPREHVSAVVAGRRVEVELPSLLLHDVDVFITMPVPKVHVMTGVSLGFKNQWGCLPDVKRLRHHHRFPSAVLAVNRLLRPAMVVFDGTYFLDRTGPMEGDAVPMNLIVASDDLGAGSLACCDIMQIDPMVAPQLALARREGMMPATLDSVALNRPLDAFRTRKFRLERTWLNWVTLGAFRSQLATRLIYDSRIARPVHQLLYLIRGAPRDVAPQW